MRQLEQLQQLQIGRLSRVEHRRGGLHSVDAAPQQDGKPDEKKRPMLREENLPGHLTSPQLSPGQQPDQGDKEKEKLVPPSAPTGDESIDNDAQLKRSLDLLKSWDVFKQLVQKKAA